MVPRYGERGQRQQAPVNSQLQISQTQSAQSAH